MGALGLSSGWLLDHSKELLGLAASRWEPRFILTRVRGTDWALYDRWGPRGGCSHSLGRLGDRGRNEGWLGRCPRPRPRVPAGPAPPSLCRMTSTAMMGR